MEAPRSRDAISYFHTLQTLHTFHSVTCKEPLRNIAQPLNLDTASGDSPPLPLQPLHRRGRAEHFPCAGVRGSQRFGSLGATIDPAARRHAHWMELDILSPVKTEKLKTGIQ